MATSAHPLPRRVDGFALRLIEWRPPHLPEDGVSVAIDGEAGLFIVALLYLPSLQAWWFLRLWTSPPTRVSTRRGRR